MVDSIPIQKTLVSATQIKSQALMTLLKSGPKQGMVLSQEGGKVQLDFGGKKVLIEAKGMSLQSGQMVVASLKNGKILLQLKPRDSQASSTENKTSIRGLADTLQQMGLKGNQFEVLAKALVQAGIPLDKTVLKELAQVLPQVTQNQSEVLQLLFSRGLPVSSSVIALFTQFLSQRKRLSESLEKLFPLLEKLDQELEDIDDDIIQGIRERLGQHQENLQQQLNYTWEQLSRGDTKTIAEQIQLSLQTLEAMILEGKTESLEITIRRFLQELKLLQAQTQNAQLMELIVKAIEQVEVLQNSQVVQHVKNVPLQGDAFPVWFIQIPYREQGISRDIEIKYKKENVDHSQGMLDLRIEMSQLGPMHLNFLWRDPCLSLKMIVSQEEIKDFIDPYLDELSVKLKEKGINLQSIHIMVDQVPDSLEPMSDIVTGEIKNLDIHV